jgi:ketosteroid isomerase-like protein
MSNLANRRGEFHNCFWPVGEMGIWYNRQIRGKTMSNSSANGAVLVTIALILVLLFVVASAGIYYVAERQSTAVALATERARQAEVQAGIEGDEARKEAAVAVAQRNSAGDQGLSPNQDDAIRTAVESMLRTQEDAWNRGDIDAFVDHYWKSDDLTFSSEGKTTRGWNATLARYRERYGTPEKMGRLSLSGLEITPLGDSAALVLGQWKLERESEPVSGNFSLVLRKLDGRWVIVHDHTSRLVE